MDRVVLCLLSWVPFAVLAHFASAIAADAQAPATGPQVETPSPSSAKPVAPIIELSAGQAIEGAIGDDDPTFMAYPYDRYRLRGKKGDRVSLLIRPQLDVIARLQRAGGDPAAAIVFSTNAGTGSAGTSSGVLPADGDYDVMVYAWQPDARGRYALTVDVEPVAGVAIASAFTPFPTIPDMPGMPQFAAARELYASLVTPSWTPAVVASGSGVIVHPDSDGPKIPGAAFCAGHNGPVEVRYDAPADTPQALSVFRGRDAGCNGYGSALTEGVYRLASGRTIVGHVRLSRDDLLIEPVGPLVAWDDQGVYTGVADDHGRITWRASWNPRTQALLWSESGDLYGAQASAARVVYPGIGYIEGEVRGGHFIAPLDASFVATDESYRASGAVIESTDVPAGAVRRGTARSGGLYLSGPIRIETRSMTSLGPPGAYLYDGTLEPGALPDLARPEPGTLANYAPLAAACSLHPELPVGWLAWGPDCRQHADRLYAWSVDGRYRLQYGEGTKTVMQSFDPARPGHVDDEWRAAQFSSDRVPAIVGRGELWHEGQLVFRGEFAGLKPQGDGQCPNETDGMIEACSYADGERVDAIYLARVEQRKLDARRDAVSQLRMQAAAEEQARRDPEMDTGGDQLVPRLAPTVEPRVAPGAIPLVEDSAHSAAEAAPATAPTATPDVASLAPVSRPAPTNAGDSVQASVPAAEAPPAAAAAAQAAAEAPVAKGQTGAALQADAAPPATGKKKKGGGHFWGKLASVAAGSLLTGKAPDMGDKASLLFNAARDGWDATSQDGAAETGAAAPNAALNAEPAESAGSAATAQAAVETDVAPAATAEPLAPATVAGYTPRPNTLDGQPACDGYTVDNYQQFFAAHQSGPDVQLHAMCAAAYNYYAMYLNAIRQGYSQQDSDRSYAAFSSAAKVATDFYATAQ
ncbi:hypothetical protein [Solimonas marina]|uniref:WG containing repeat-containing protein n=1 Tax=Solimonas marina TaxID=2714601 RepID=A0A969WF00_9GAMM|nr:hypothetical protein [Solimonas marina]NKF23535.1 hypothetical protein [Solimonas marina]